MSGFSSMVCRIGLFGLLSAGAFGLTGCNDAQEAQRPAGFGEDAPVTVVSSGAVSSEESGVEPGDGLESSGEWLIVAKQENADSGVVVRLKAALDRPDRNAQVMWVQKSGPAVTVINPAALTAEIILPISNEITPLVFEITATSQGETLRAEQTIMVMPLAESNRAAVTNTVLQPTDNTITVTLTTPVPANSALGVAIVGGSAVDGIDFELDSSTVTTADGRTVIIPMTLLPANRAEDVYAKVSMVLPNGEAATITVVIPQSTSEAVTQAASSRAAAENSSVSAVSSITIVNSSAAAESSAGVVSSTGTNSSVGVNNSAESSTDTGVNSSTAVSEAGSASSDQASAPTTSSSEQMDLSSVAASSQDTVSSEEGSSQSEASSTSSDGALSSDEASSSEVSSSNSVSSEAISSEDVSSQAISSQIASSESSNAGSDSSQVNSSEISSSAISSLESSSSEVSSSAINSSEVSSAQISSLESSSSEVSSELSSTEASSSATNSSEAASSETASSESVSSMAANSESVSSAASSVTIASSSSSLLSSSSIGQSSSSVLPSSSTQSSSASVEVSSSSSVESASSLSAGSESSVSSEEPSSSSSAANSSASVESSSVENSSESSSENSSESSVVSSIASSLADSSSAPSSVISSSSSEGSSSVIASSDSSAAISSLSSSSEISSSLAVSSSTVSSSAVSSSIESSSSEVSSEVSSSVVISSSSDAVSSQPVSSSSEPSSSASSESESSEVVSSSSVASSSSSIAPRLPELNVPSEVLTYTVGTQIENLNLDNTGDALISCEIDPPINNLKFEKNTGGTACILSGTPTTTQPQRVHTITAINAAGDVQPTLMITVNPAAPELSEVSAQILKEKREITPIILTNSGGELTDCPQGKSNLPTGLIVKAENNTCVISGKPDQSQALGTYSVTAVNGFGGESTQTFEIEITEFAPFVTTWDTRLPGVSADNQIQILTAPDVEYNFDIDWGDGTIQRGVTTSVTHQYRETGVKTISITGKYPRHYPYNFEEDDEGKESLPGDAHKLLSVNAWGDIEWQSMNGAFRAAKNMVLLETAPPNLSSVTDLSNMFDGAEVFNSDLKSWDFSSIENMSGMFRFAISFDQDVSDWNVSAALTDTNHMFAATELFNSGFDDWDFSNVTDMSGMFWRTKSFNQDLHEWNVSNKLTNTSGMFLDAIAFNGDMSGWDVSSVVSMPFMFGAAIDSSIFNQDISGWDVTSVQDMSGMFAGNSAFNQDISNWDITSVQNISSMFSGNSAFNQDISSWEVTSVTDMSFMFFGATAFSVSNYDALLQSWSRQSLQPNVTLHVDSKYSINSIDARKVLTDTFDWVIDDGGVDLDVPSLINPIAQVIEINQPFTLRIPNTGGGSIECTDNGLPNGLETTTLVDEDGTFCVISGTPDTEQIADDYTITAENLADKSSVTFKITVNPPAPSIDDAPSQTFTVNQPITNLTFTNANTFGSFNSCTLLPEIKGLNVSFVEGGNECTISGTPEQAQPAQSHTLTVGNAAASDTATVMIAVNPEAPVLGGAPAQVYEVNQPIDRLVFSNTGGDIETCEPNNLPAGLQFEFDQSECAVFGTPTAVQPDTPLSITAKNITDESVATVSITVNPPEPSPVELEPLVYTVGHPIPDLALNLQNNLNAPVTCDRGDLPEGLRLTATADNVCVLSGTPKFKQAANDHMVEIKNDGGKASLTLNITINNPFVTIWKTDNAGMSGDDEIFLRVDDDYAYDFDVSWGDGTIERGLTESTSHTYPSAGEYEVSISGEFPAIRDWCLRNNKFIAVKYWGDVKWQTMEDAFNGCRSFELKANDAPDLSNVTSMQSMFEGVSDFNDDMDWDVSTIKDMSRLFFGASSFNGDISSWDVSAVEDMSYMFANATEFNGEIGGWTVSSVVDMQFMFNNAAAFNQPLGWDVSNVKTMAHMFNGAINFDGASYVDPMTSLNRDISVWDVTAVEDMTGMFFNASAFNGDLSEWAVTSVKAMNTMFFGATAFNADIGGWMVGTVEDMSSMFNGATRFNADVSNWDVSSAISLSQMFTAAALFDQNLGRWDVSKVSNMADIFKDTALSTPNYDAILQGWGTLPDLQSDVIVRDIGAMYSPASITARATLVDTFKWVINDQGLNLAPPSLAEVEDQIFVLGQTVLLRIANEGGGDIRCEVDGLPAELPANLTLSTFTEETGQTFCSITGTATVEQVANTYTIKAINAAGQSSVSFSITINPPQPQLTDAALQTFTVNTKIDALIFTVPGNLGSLMSCELTPEIPDLKADISGDGNACIISGTPSQAQGQTPHTVIAKNAGGTGEAALPVIINPEAPRLANITESQVYTVGQQIPETLLFANSGGPLESCSKESPLEGDLPLPEGLDVMSTAAGCVMSGRPTVLQPATVHTISATNITDTDTATVSIAIVPLRPRLGRAFPLNLTVGDSFSEGFVNAGGGDLIACEIEPKPEWIDAKISDDGNSCVVSGLPTLVFDSPTLIPFLSSQHEIISRNAGGEDRFGFSINVSPQAPFFDETLRLVLEVDKKIEPVELNNLGGGALAACLKPENFPNGLEFNVKPSDRSTCVISGTPRIDQKEKSHRVSASNITDTATADIVITIKQPPEIVRACNGDLPEIDSGAAMADNPYTDSIFYVDPDFTARVESSQKRVIPELSDAMESVKEQPTGIWLDSQNKLCGEVEDGRLRFLDHLKNADKQAKEQGKPVVLSTVVFNVPSRDCISVSHPGEFGATPKGLEGYKEYIDTIAALAANFPDVRVVAAIEPGALASTIEFNDRFSRTNTDECRAAFAGQYYQQSIVYALQKFAEVPNLYSYIDAGHAAWLGWRISEVASTINNWVRTASDGISANFDILHGLTTNISEYIPYEEPYMMDSSPSSLPFYTWNEITNASDFAFELSTEMKKFTVNSSGISTRSLGVIVDTSRNGWGGAQRPTTMGFGVDFKLDRRQDRWYWCNNEKAGMGEFPIVSPLADDPHIDAFFWFKPPGESDGDMVNACSNFENPARSSRSYEAKENPTLAGEWFHEHFVQLVQNAWPVLLAQPEVTREAEVSLVFARQPVQDLDDINITVTAPISIDRVEMVSRGESIALPETTVISGTEAIIPLSGLTIDTLKQTLMINLIDPDGIKYVGKLGFDAGGNVITGSPISDLLITSQDGIWRAIEGGDGDDWVIDLDGTVGYSITGGEGNDYLQGVRLFGGGGDDTLVPTYLSGGSTNLSAQGDEGRDTFILYKNTIALPENGTLRLSDSSSGNIIELPDVMPEELMNGDIAFDRNRNDLVLIYREGGVITPDDEMDTTDPVLTPSNSTVILQNFFDDRQPFDVIIVGGSLVIRPDSPIFTPLLGS